jgi:type I restriction enzyme S subunit
LQLSDIAFMEMPVLLPPPDEEAAIVRFLDHANRKIDRFIRAKRKMIALLNEQKHAIINRAVTRGLNPDIRLKPSGVPWLGDIPEHWEVRRIKQVTKILRGKFSHRPRNDASLYDGEYPFIQTGSVARAKKFITHYTQTLNEKGLSVSKVFPKGTLCMTIAANIGDVAILDFEACFPDSIVGFVPNAQLDRDFLYLVFRCMKDGGAFWGGAFWGQYIQLLFSRTCLLPQTFHPPEIPPDRLPAVLVVQKQSENNSCTIRYSRMEHSIEQSIDSQ